ncbi:hypothetical protein CJ197_04800 [Brachybacterium sp. UMB0905]|nr:hypothetical protein CJ197_04800 [Brachybacterium sp. UMB0905]
MTELSVSTARARLADVVDAARVGRHPIYLTRRGRRVAAVIDADRRGPARTPHRSLPRHHPPRPHRPPGTRPPATGARRGCRGGPARHAHALCAPGRGERARQGCDRPCGRRSRARRHGARARQRIDRHSGRRCAHRAPPHGDVPHAAGRDGARDWWLDGHRHPRRQRPRGEPALRRGRVPGRAGRFPGRSGDHGGLLGLPVPRPHLHLVRGRTDQARDPRGISPGHARGDRGQALPHLELPIRRARGHGRPRHHTRRPRLHARRGPRRRHPRAPRALTGPPQPQPTGTVPGIPPSNLLPFDRFRMKLDA